MISFIENAEPLLQGFWYVAIPISFIFLAQGLITFLGIDFGLDTNFDNIDVIDGFELFSVRNFINFLLGFSWTGICFYSSIANPALLIFAAILVGLFFVYLFFKVISWMMKLAEDNTFQISEAIGQAGEVYLTIPAYNQGFGKVLISVQGAIHELPSVTNSNESIPTNQKIIVIGLDQNNNLIVEKI